MSVYCVYIYPFTALKKQGTPEVTTIYLLSANGSEMVRVRGAKTDGVAAVGEEMRNLATMPESVYDLANCAYGGDISMVQKSVKEYNHSNEFLDEDGLLWMAASAELNSEHVIGRAIVRHAQSRKHLPPLEVRHSFCLDVGFFDIVISCCKDITYMRVYATDVIP